MLERQVRVINPLGLHARAAARLVRLAAGFESEITLLRSDAGTRADAKSILELLRLAAAFDSNLTIRVEGVDEEEAAADVVKLFLNDLGEL